MKNISFLGIDNKVKNIIAIFAICSFSLNTIAVNSNSKSPNQLIRFSVDCTNYSAQIKWTTSEEKLKSTFVVEKTKDGVHYETVITLNNSVVNEPTFVAHEYSILDETPYSGISYYRILELDSDKNIINVNTIVYTPCENEESINSVIDEDIITVSLNSTCDAINVCNVSIVDVKNNTLVFDNVYKVVSGMNTFKIDNKFDSGNYKIIIEHKNHKRFSKDFLLR